LLTKGVTTVVGNHPDSERLNEIWSGKEIPGPRLLNISQWNIGPTPRPELDVTAAIVTSRSTGLSTGQALAAQFRAMQIAGLTAEQTLRSMGVNAAAAMLADPYLGRIATGAAADLVFVDGDPLADIDDVLNVVATVRNGRFYSVSGLIDRAKSAKSVE
jgi:predicted amidohydrolase YtcJ